MRYWKNFRLWPDKNYNISDNSVVNTQLLIEEIVLFDVLTVDKLSKYLSLEEEFFFKYLATMESMHAKSEIMICYYNLFKMLQHRDYYEVFLVLCFRKVDGDVVFTIPKKIPDSKVPIEIEKEVQYRDPCVLGLDDTPYNTDFKSGLVINSVWDVQSESSVFKGKTHVCVRDTV